MASKSVFQKYHTDALDYFDLASDPIYGVIAGSNVEDVLVTQDETTYIEVSIDGIMSVVPMSEDNTHYSEILKQVADGDLTIKDAD